MASRLKALRLSSPRFAYLNLVRQSLFNEIDFVATLEHVERLAQADLRWIAPFVKRVNFVAPLHSWALKFEAFKEIVIAQAIQKYQYDHGIEDGEQLPKKFIQEHWNGKLPFTYDQIRRAFENYHLDALAIQDLLNGDATNALKGAWTRVLRELTKVHEVCFKGTDYEATGGEHLPAKPDCVIRPHHHYSNHRKEICRETAAPVGDAVFVAGIHCLAQANIQVWTVKVASAMTDLTNWEEIPGWKEVDLSQLQNFGFQPQFHVNEYTIHDPVAVCAASAIAAVLKKCGHGLKRFSKKGHCPVQWPGNEVVKLPKLEQLAIEHGPIHPGNLRNWMAEMPSLEHFHLHNTYPFDDHYGDIEYHCWREVFRAIRNHRKPLHVVFRDNLANSCMEFSLDYYTDEVESYLDELQIPESDFDRDLPLYLSGRIEWNESLEECFLNW